MEKILRKIYRSCKRELLGRINRNRKVADVFESIYRKNLWGGKPGEFCSGDGTSDLDITAPYVARITDLSEKEGFAGKTFVDLGCGDFRVGSKLAPLSGRYFAIDVVKPLIQSHLAANTLPNVSFCCLDMIDDEIPDGDVCFIRQVFQHLSNDQISRILPKLTKFRWVFITEHLPSDPNPIYPNLEKVQGTEIRLMQDSGVYLNLPPFSLPAAQLETVLEIPGHEFGGGVAEPGVIRTVLYRPCQDA